MKNFILMLLTVLVNMIAMAQSGSGLTPLLGYANNNADCDFEYPFYVDADGDTYGAGSLVSVCAVDATTPPAGYSLNNTDCNDANPNEFQMGTFFVDFDNDGSSSGVKAELCYGNSTPSGYLTYEWFIGMDCNDLLDIVYYGAPEILYNGIDENCNHELDDDHQLYVGISGQCGDTLASIGETIYADNDNNATGYRFKVINISTGAIQILERPVRWFKLTQLPSHNYATSYAIWVELQRDGIWLGYYGYDCLVSTPAILGTGGAQVGESQCGAVLPTIQTIIMSNNIPNATGYRFRITNLTDPLATSHVQVLDRSIRWFTLQMLTNYNYGTTYRVEVAVKTTGGYSAFGTPCLIGTPAVPTLTHCGATVTSETALVATSSLNKVTSYKFELTDLTTNMVTVIERPLHYFRFNSIGDYTAGGNYSVRVAVMTAGYYSVFGPPCTVTAPGLARSIGVKNTPAIITVFKAVAFPNPYVDSFAVDLTSDSNEEMQVKVYDMIGKLFEVRTVSADAIDEQTFGDRYPSGIYIVTLTQGNVVKTLRIIKR